MKDSLFGKYCYIDTPGSAGKKTVYRILASDTESNTYCEVPYLFNQKPVPHGYNFERIVYVVLDTLADEDSEILRFALRDVEVIGDIEEDKKRGEWIGEYYTCSECGESLYDLIDADSYFRKGFSGCNFCPNCGKPMKKRGETDA